MLGYDNGLGPDANPIFGGPETAGLSHSIIDGQVVVTPEEILRAGQQALAPVRTGANDQDLAVSPAQTTVGLFTMSGLSAEAARKLYEPGKSGFW
jgi:hypothetical protein